MKKIFNSKTLFLKKIHNTQFHVFVSGSRQNYLDKENFDFNLTFEKNVFRVHFTQIYFKMKYLNI